MEVSTYDQEVDKDPVKAVVYVFSPEQIAREPERFSLARPGARYLEVLQEGAAQFGLEEEYMRTQLGTLRPRLQTSNLLSCS